MNELLSIEDALARILERVEPLPGEDVSLEQATGRVVSAPVSALVDLPPFPSSAMDGFALRAGDTPGTLPVVASIPAGRPVERELAAGEAMAIATGGVVPQGADAVVPIEHVVECDNNVEISTGVEPGANVRPRGGDVRAGEDIVASGTELRAAQIGALAAAGIAMVRCARRPRAAVLATGTELRPAGAPLGPGQVYEANAIMLVAQLESAGAEAERLPAVADDEEAHRAALARGLEADLLVTTGGVSVGIHDLVRRIEAELGVEEVFWGVAVKPGKPLAFGVRDRTLVFGLPGNPVSTLVGFELFVRPAVRALQGVADPGPAYSTGRLAGTVRRNEARDQLVRARAAVSGGELVLDALTGQESHMIARSAAANALVLVRRGKGALERGEEVRFLPL